MDASLRKLYVDFRNVFLKCVHFVSEKFLRPLSASEDDRRREYILNIILLSSVALLIIFDGLVLRHYFLRGGEHEEAISPFAFSILPLFFIFLQTLSRKGFFILASYLLIGIYFLSNTYAIYRWGIELQAALLGYALLIIIASILISTRFGFFMTALIAASIILFWHLQSNHIMIIQQSIHENDDAIVFSILYFLIMIVAWLSNREIEKSLSRARISEHALEKQRDFLEIEVEERTRELRETQFEKIKQVHRFAEFGQLASGLFHDLLNILNAISLRIENRALTKSSLGEALGTTKQVERFMHGMRKQLNHRESQESFSLVEGINQVIQLLSYKATKERVRIVFRHNPQEAIMYFGDSFKFHQAMINLLLNAIESYEDLSNNATAQTVTIILEKTERILIRVEDRGCGIPQKLLNKIFEPFFTTKPGANGIGIGLATVKKIVEEDFRGTIELHSEEGKGTTFTVSFEIRES